MNEEQLNDQVMENQLTEEQMTEEQMTEEQTTEEQSSEEQMTEEQTSEEQSSSSGQYMSESVFFDLSGKDSVDIPPGYKDRCMAAWMSFLPDSVKLGEMFIPGTHESGTYSMQNERKAHFQTYNITSQLLNGMRYLDLRIRGRLTNSSKPDDPRSWSLEIVHGSVIGRELSVLLYQIKQFIDAVPEEIILLDFQDILGDREKHPGMAELAAITMLEAIFHEKIFAEVTGNLSELTLGELRAEGKRLIIFWGSNYTHNKNYLFYRVDHLYSPYDEKVYQSDSINPILNYLTDRSRERWYEQNRRRMFVSQAISTPVIRTPKELEERHGKALNGWVTDAIKNKMALNIVIRDYFDWYPQLIGQLIMSNKEKVEYKKQNMFGLITAAKRDSRLTRLAQDTFYYENVQSIFVNRRVCLREYVSQEKILKPDIGGYNRNIVIFSAEIDGRRGRGHVDIINTNTVQQLRRISG